MAHDRKLARWVTRHKLGDIINAPMSYEPAVLPSVVPRDLLRREVPPCPVQQAAAYAAFT